MRALFFVSSLIFRNGADLAVCRPGNLYLPLREVVAQGTGSQSHGSDIGIAVRAGTIGIGSYSVLVFSQDGLG